MATGFGSEFGCLHNVGSFIDKPQGLVVSFGAYTMLIVLPHANCVCGRVYCFHVRPTDRTSDRLFP